ncbi:hypothetical protein NL478_27370, partial [Klebsiella pneumoniae]|nr:hypothetical protein [Klebsiella pneumoniae]
VKEILIFIIKAILEDNGANHIARSTAQDEGGITGRAISFSQFLHKALGFLLNTVLNAPFPHPQVPQGHECEAPYLFPSLAIAK